MLADARIVPDQVHDESMKNRSNRDADQDERTIEHGYGAEYRAGIDAPAMVLGLRHGGERTADSAQAEQHSDRHHGEQQQQINHVELADPSMKGTLRAAEPCVVVLVGFEPLMREGCQHVKSDQGQNCLLYTS